MDFAMWSDGRSSDPIMAEGFRCNQTDGQERDLKWFEIKMLAAASFSFAGRDFKKERKQV